MRYPAAVEVDSPDTITNWRPLVQWLLAIPHLILVEVLGSLSMAIGLVSWFSIVFTGKIPAGLVEIQVMILRYSLRVQAYAGFLHEEYPPFEFSTETAEPGGTPTSVSFVPVLQDRNRLTVGLRFIWIIPAMFYAMVIGIIAMLAQVAAAFAILFTGKWPMVLREWVMKGMRVSNRLNAYAMLLTDEYPPFRTD